MTDTTTTDKPKSEKPKGAEKFDPQLGLFVDDKGKPVVRKAQDKGKAVSREGFEIDVRSVFDKDQNVVMSENRTVTRDENGFYTHLAGRKELSIKPRKYFRKGTHWRVVAEGVRMEGMAHFGKGANGADIWSGIAVRLPVGTIIECIGWRRFRKDGMVAPQFTHPSLPAETRWSTVWPKDSVWRPWPLAGILELVEEDQL